jgi:hypothetical protein
MFFKRFCLLGVFACGTFSQSATDYLRNGMIPGVLDKVLWIMEDRLAVEAAKYAPKMHGLKVPLHLCANKTDGTMVTGNLFSFQPGQRCHVLDEFSALCGIYQYCLKD